VENCAGKFFFVDATVWSAIRGRANGIYTYEFDSKNGILTPEIVRDNSNIISKEEIGENPTYLCCDPSKKYLFSVQEIGVGGGSDVKSFLFDRKDKMKVTKINSVKSEGLDGCHLIYHPLSVEGGLLFIAHYSSGSFSTISVKPNGELNILTQTNSFDYNSKGHERQECSHAHSIFMDLSTNKYAFVVDLGADRIYQFIIDEESKTLKENANAPYLQLKEGSGPRHMIFHPSYKFAYIFHELSCMVDICRYDSTKGTLSFQESITSLPNDFKGNASGSAIRISQDGKALYVANRFHDSIGVFSVDSETGKLTCIQHQNTFGKTPRDFIIDQSGKWLLVPNQDSDSLVVFKIDSETRKLTKESEIKVISPACLLEM